MSIHSRRGIVRKTAQNLVLVYEGVEHGQSVQKERTARTIFTDKKGKEIAFSPGQIWVEIVPGGNEVSY